MKLEQLCKAMAERLAALGEAFGDAAVEHERPPHY
jgi:uncharacterized coiled-coil protein SlyX